MGADLRSWRRGPPEQKQEKKEALLLETDEELSGSRDLSRQRNTQLGRIQGRAGAGLGSDPGHDSGMPAASGCVDSARSWKQEEGGEQRLT